MLVVSTFFAFALPFFAFALKVEEFQASKPGRSLKSKLIALCLCCVTGTSHHRTVLMRLLERSPAVFRDRAAIQAHFCICKNFLMHFGNPCAVALEAQELPEPSKCQLVRREMGNQRILGRSRMVQDTAQPRPSNPTECAGVASKCLQCA